jgi:hypothetical protein
MAGIRGVDVPVLANGCLARRYYLRKQARARTVHRYGNILKTYREGFPGVLQSGLHCGVLVIDCASHQVYNVPDARAPCEHWE